MNAQDRRTNRNAIERVLGAKTFNKLFPVILTDNGSEFSNPKEIEYRDAVPSLRTKVFYCDPSSPYQKGACEVNHELIRRITRSAFITEKICLRNSDVHRLPPRTSS